jgi:hypothetical protein
VNPRPHRLHGEDGVSLLLALGFLVLFGLTIPPLLNLGTTNLLTSSRLQEQRATVYAANGVTDAAIQYLRAHPECGRLLPLPGSACPITSGSTTSFAGSADGKSATTSITVPDTVTPLDLDRTLDLATTVAGSPQRVDAHVVIRDSKVNGSSVTEPPVDVQSWKYSR